MIIGVVDKIAIEPRNFPFVHPIAAAGAEFGFTRCREIAKSGYRADTWSTRSGAKR